MFQRLVGQDANYPTETNINTIQVEEQVMKVGTTFKVKSGGSLKIKVLTDGKTVSTAQLLSLIHI